MKRIFFFIFLFFLLALNSAHAISADLGEVGVGARPLSLGKAYVGLADDASAVFLNPAGIRENPEMGIVSMTGKMLNDITYVSFAITNPFAFGSLGLGYINASTSGIPLTTLTTTSTEVLIDQYGVTDYSSSILYLSYSKDMMKDVYFGGSLKLFSQGFSQDTGSLEGGNGTGLDMDLGVKWKLAKGSSLGIVAQNILPMNMGGKFIWKNGYEESIPSSFKVGTSLKIWGEDGFSEFRGQDLNLNIDSEMSYNSSRPGVWHAGLEWWPNKVLALRAGVDQKPKATAQGVGVDNNFAGGVGFKYKGFSFDYAYHQYGELSDNASHFFSIGFLGEREPRTLKSSVKEKMEKGIVAELKQVEGLKKFQDVPDDYWAKDPIEYLATLGIVSGYPDNTFKPDKALTRGELAALLVKAKGFELETITKDVFPDVSYKNWAAPYVDMAVKRKYVSGYPDGKFRPWKEVSRAEAIIVISRFAGLVEPLSLSNNPFPDVQKRHWAARSIAVAKQNGLLEYLSGHDFEPDKPFTRAEAAEVISKTDFAKEKIKDLLKSSQSKPSTQEAK